MGGGRVGRENIVAHTSGFREESVLSVTLCVSIQGQLSGCRLGTTGLGDRYNKGDLDLNPARAQSLEVTGKLLHN